MLLHPTAPLPAANGEALPKWPQNGQNPPKRGSQRARGAAEERTGRGRLAAPLGLGAARGPDVTTPGMGHRRSGSAGDMSSGASGPRQQAGTSAAKSEPERVRGQTKGGKCLTGQGRWQRLTTCCGHGKAQTWAAPAQGLAHAPPWMLTGRSPHTAAGCSQCTATLGTSPRAGHPCPGAGTVPDCSPCPIPCPAGPGRGQEPGNAPGGPWQRALAVTPPLLHACPAQPLCRGGSHTALCPVLSWPWGLQSGILPWAGARRFPPVLGSGRQQPCAHCSCLLLPQ